MKNEILFDFIEFYKTTDFNKKLLSLLSDNNSFFIRLTPREWNIFSVCLNYYKVEDLDFISKSIESLNTEYSKDNLFTLVRLLK